MHPRFKRYWKQALSFGLIWLLFGWVYVLLEYGILGSLEYYPSTGNKYDFWNARIVNTFGSFLTGFIQGWIEVAWLRSKFEKRPLWQKVLFKSIFYLVLIIVFLLIIAWISNTYRFDVGFLDPLVVESLENFVFSFVFLSVIAYVALVIIVALFFSETGVYLGLGEQYNFFFGKYHRAKQETRIFMFLDMKSSTTIAEQMGHKQYFHLLKAYYADMTEALLQSAAEVYQYVGDEIVISWNLKDGCYQHNCLRCFMLIKEAIAKKREFYENTFGVVPEFKAGMHIGEVTVGEIGIIKKDIIYTGDVLNTTARVQAKCNELKAQLLVTEDLYKQLAPLDDYEVIPKGDLILKGKTWSVSLYQLIPE